MFTCSCASLYSHFLSLHTKQVATDCALKVTHRENSVKQIHSVHSRLGSLPISTLPVDQLARITKVKVSALGLHPKKWPTHTFVCRIDRGSRMSTECTKSRTVKKRSAVDQMWASRPAVVEFNTSGKGDKDFKALTPLCLCAFRRRVRGRRKIEKHVWKTLPFILQNFSLLFVLLFPLFAEDTCPYLLSLSLFFWLVGCCWFCKPVSH